jgi:hypothetical protein
MAQAPAREVDDGGAQGRRGRLLIADVSPAAPDADERFLGGVFGQAPVTGKGESEPHQLGVMALVQQRQSLTA